MALFKVRPSRGSWAFFGLITVAVITQRQRARYEQRVIRRDGPVAESARAFATCLFGPDISWVLREDAPVTQHAQWSFRIGSWLQSHAAGSLEHDWPARCVAPLDELEGRLRNTARPPSDGFPIGDLRMALQPTGSRPLDPTRPNDPAARAVEWQNRFIRGADDRSGLPSKLATLFVGVRDLSLGTRDRWSPFPLRQEQYPMPPPPVVPRWRDVPANQSQTVLVSPTVYFFRRGDDGRVHRVDFDRLGAHDAELGAAVPWREAPRGGVLRASTEQGGALIALEPTTRIVPLPDEPGVARRGEAFDWQAATSPDGLAWLTRTRGTARLRVARFGDDGARWSDPLTLGYPQSQMGAVVAPDPFDASRWRVTLLRQRALDVVVEQHLVTATAAGLTATPGVRHPPVALASTQRMVTCGLDGVRYVALLNDRGGVVLRVEGDRLDEVRVPGAPWGVEPTLRCDAERALLVGAPATATAPAAVLTFAPGREASAQIVEPLPSDRETGLRELLLVDDGLVAIAANAASLRAWRRPIGGARWEPAGYLGPLTPQIDTRRMVSALRGASQGRSLAVWIEGEAVRRTQVEVPGTGENRDKTVTEERVTRTPFRVLMMSEDSGRSFAGLPDLVRGTAGAASPAAGR